MHDSLQTSGEHDEQEYRTKTKKKKKERMVEGGVDEK